MGDKGALIAPAKPPAALQRRHRAPAASAAHLLVLLMVAACAWRAGQLSAARHAQPAPIAHPAGSRLDALAAPDAAAAATPSSVLVSYSYFEKDAIQAANFDFFLTAGMGVGSRFPAPAATDFVLVVTGPSCAPCQRLAPLVRAAPELALPALGAVYVGEHITLLHRTENVGMDFGAHNATLTWLAAHAKHRRYAHFIFLNSSAKGPFVPPAAPAGWHWPQAYTGRLRGDVKAVGSSLVCLPEVDAGGPGPRLESWAFAVDGPGLELLVRAGVFHVHTEKLGSEGIVVRGEYGITITLLAAGYNVDTLMALYREVDWRDPRHWRCNNNTHPSRHGTYQGISFHPFETLFVKSSWHVADEFTQRYAAWALAQAAGRDTTGGAFDAPAYFWAISPAAQGPTHMEACYRHQA